MAWPRGSGPPGLAVSSTDGRIVVSIRTVVQRGPLRLAGAERPAQAGGGPPLGASRAGA